MGTIAIPSLHGEPDQRGDRHVLVICTGEACREAGAEDLVREVNHRCRHHDSKRVRTGASRCMGHCAAAPAAMENGKLLRWLSLPRLRLELSRLGLLR